MTIFELAASLVGMGCKVKDIINSDPILAVGYWRLPTKDTQNYFLCIMAYEKDQTRRLLKNWLDSILEEEKAAMLAITDLSTLRLYSITTVVVGVPSK